MHRSWRPAGFDMDNHSRQPGDCKRYVQRMVHDLLPEHWKLFATQHSLVGREIEFPWPGKDELVAVIEIFDDGSVEHEARGAYPGIVVLRDGFVPIGGCSIGTGDPYFLNVLDGPAGPIYKIDHTQVHSNGYNHDTAVTEMLGSYHDLLRYVST